MPNKVREHVQNLKHENFNVRENAAWMLGNIKHESAVPHLIQAVLKDKHWAVRTYAAEALGEIKHEKAVKPLIQALKDENLHVRFRAVEALGRIKHESAVKPLTKALKDKSWEVRRQAASSLFEIAEALEKLRKEELTPEGQKLLKAIKLVKPHFQENEDSGVKARALQAAYNGKINEEKQARLYVKELRAHKGHLK